MSAGACSLSAAFAALTNLTKMTSKVSCATMRLPPYEMVWQPLCYDGSPWRGLGFMTRPLLDNHESASTQFLRGDLDRAGSGAGLRQEKRLGIVEAHEEVGRRPLSQHDPIDRSRVAELV